MPKISVWGWVIIFFLSAGGLMAAGVILFFKAYIETEREGHYIPKSVPFGFKFEVTLEIDGRRVTQSNHTRLDVVQNPIYFGSSATFNTIVRTGEGLGFHLPDGGVLFVTIDDVLRSACDIRYRRDFEDWAARLSARNLECDVPADKLPSLMVIPNSRNLNDASVYSISRLHEILGDRVEFISARVSSSNQPTENNWTEYLSSLIEITEGWSGAGQFHMEGRDDYLGSISISYLSRGSGLL